MFVGQFKSKSQNKYSKCLFLHWIRTVSTSTEFNNGDGWSVAKPTNTYGPRRLYPLLGGNWKMADLSTIYFMAFSSTVLFTYILKLLSITIKQIVLLIKPIMSYNFHRISTLRSTHVAYLIHIIFLIKPQKRFYT